MIKKTITYTDFNDVKRTEDFYFNITRGELLESELSHTGEGSWSDYMETVSKSKDNRLIMDTFKSILKLAYGIKTEDGKRFAKSDDIWLSFYQSEAYSEFLIQLISDAGSAAEFVGGLFSGLPTGKSPSDLAREASQAQLQGHQQKTQPSVQTVPDLETVQADTSSQIVYDANPPSTAAEPVVPQDISGLSREELIARIQANPSGFQPATNQ